jgi:hypothetical protein
MNSQISRAISFGSPWPVTPPRCAGSDPRTSLYLSTSWPGMSSTAEKSRNTHHAGILRSYRLRSIPLGSVASTIGDLQSELDLRAVASCASKFLSSGIGSGEGQRGSSFCALHAQSLLAWSVLHASSTIIVGFRVVHPHRVSAKAKMTPDDCAENRHISRWPCRRC